MSINQSLIQFTPRQVVMALEPQAKKEKKEKKEKKGSSEIVEGCKEMVLNGGDVSAKGKGRDVLIRSIAGFLESNGFKKTLAMFQSEAQIEENSWKSAAVNLNDFVAKILDSRDVLAVPAIENDKSQDTEKETEKKLGKEKRKKKSSKDLKQVENERVANADKINKKKEPDPSENGNVKTEEKDKKKEKEEKKKKKKEVEEVKGIGEENAIVEEMEPNERKKDRKKRKEYDSSENEETETGENVAKKKDKDGKKKPKKESEAGKETQEEEKVTEKETNVETEEKTVSKKRKKGEEGNVENDGKKRKLEEENAGAYTASEENINGDNSGKKEKQSAEPKSANAFKRVKVEEVKFVDERLTDNSYWAKSGADSGYGAKAQQILEQVRGRDFRHEKTKKKRGTYRGGQIDLQSHSIKFNYSDEE